jgi:3-hydroxy acid dehydrogenase / malonic semialdehyde reductase
MYPTIDPVEMTVLITGATSGFGKAMAVRFAAAGARIIGTGRRRDRLRALKEELGERCLTIELDVTRRDEVVSSLQSLPAPFDAIDICVANAGLALGLELAPEADLNDWNRMIETNIIGLTTTVRAVLPAMVERDRGHIVLIGSVAGAFPYPGANVYGATKAYVRHFALNLRADLLGRNVRVTNIEPGLAETEFSLVRFEGDRGKASVPYEGLTPMSADDIAEAVYWACSLPRHLNINSIQMMPVMQAFGRFATHRTSAKAG